MHNPKAIVVINLGTPDTPQKKAVSAYLTQFLNDKRVIDIPWLWRKILVNLIIIPLRVRNSTKLYQQLWTPKGSPLLFHLESLVKKLQEKTSDKYVVYAAMRYGKPSLDKILNEIQTKNFTEVVFFPLFPQYASSTTGSVYELIAKKTKHWERLPSFKYIHQYYDHPAFIDAFAEQINKHDWASYDEIVFSYHGLPNRHLDKIHPSVTSNNCTCEIEMPVHGHLCYKATCYETTRLLVKKLQIPKEKYAVGFQSRLSKNWMTPFTDQLIEKKAVTGTKSILVIAPSFTADCLETTIELGFEYKHLFTEKGGEKFTLVPGLNDEDIWVDAILKILAD